VNDLINLKDVKIPNNFEDASKLICDIHTMIRYQAAYGYWQIGRIVGEMQKREGVYGTAITDRVAEALTNAGQKISKRMVEEAHRAYTRCPDHDAMLEYISKGIEWSQIRSINKISNDEQRIKVIEEVLDKKMSVRETENLVKKVTSTPVRKQEPLNEQPARITPKHPVGFFALLSTKINEAEKKIESTNNQLNTINKELIELAKHINTMVGLSSDEKVVNDDQFNTLCISVKEIAENADRLISSLDALKNSTDIKGIENLMYTQYKKLVDRIRYEE
jgi:hypothetical protein